jgi:hypothetical protein
MGNGLRYNIRERLLQLVPDGIQDLVLGMQSLLKDGMTEDGPLHVVPLGCCRDFIFFSMIHSTVKLFVNGRRQAFLEGPLGRR